MKNQYELKFEKTVIEMILLNDHPYLSQLDLFIDFHHNSDIYYDNLCDALYELSNRHTNQPLWISASGNPYLALMPRTKEDRQVLTFDQIPEFVDDLYEPLNVALGVFQNLLKK